MAKKKTFYWLKLEKDFFDKIEIKRLRRMAGGDTYTVIYLKMLLLSLKEDGNLFYDGIGDDFIDELSLDIDEKVDDVKMVVIYLQDKNLMELLQKDEYHLNELPEMVGKESDSAVRMRRKRLNDNKVNKITSHSDTSVQESYTEIEKELETELELEKDKTISRKLKTVYDKEHYQLAELLYSEMLKNNPKAKKPNLEKWSNDIRLMVERDKRSLSDISYMIKWSQKDPFWSTNVLSTSKLRKQYDQLYMKAKQEHEAKTGTTTGKQQLTQDDWANM